MEIVEESEQNKKAWNELVRSSNGSVFHLWEWNDFISKTYGYRKLFLASFDKNEEKFEFGIPFLVTKRRR